MWIITHLRANRYATIADRSAFYTHSRANALLKMPAAKRKAAPQETEVQRCMRILDVLNFEPLRSMIEKPDLLPEYKRFLALKAAEGDLDAEKLSPPKEIDDIWHAHILDTKHYRTTCEAMGRGFIDHYPNGGADAAARDARRKACFDAYTNAFGPAPLGVRSLPWAGVRTPLAPRPQQPPPPQQQSPATNKRPRTRAPRAQLVSELDVGSYVLATVERRGRNDRWTTRQEPGWIVCKRDKCVVIYREDRAGIHVVSPGERVTLAHFQKPMPDSAKSAVPAEQDRVFIRVCNQKGDVIHCILRETTPLQRLMVSYAQTVGEDMKSIRFLFDGERIQGDQTPRDIGIEDLDCIDAIMEQCGC